MKFGVRKPSVKKSISARTTGKLKRKIKKAVNPFYGKKGTGFIKNPKKAVYNKVYNKTSISANTFIIILFKIIWLPIYYICIYPFILLYRLLRSILNKSKEQVNLEEKYEEEII